MIVIFVLLSHRTRSIWTWLCQWRMWAAGWWRRSRRRPDTPCSCKRRIDRCRIRRNRRHWCRCSLHSSKALKAAASTRPRCRRCRLPASRTAGRFEDQERPLKNRWRIFRFGLHSKQQDRQVIAEQQRLPFFLVLMCKVLVFQWAKEKYQKNWIEEMKLLSL